MSTTNVYCEEHHFVHNICHLFMDNLFPMYVALSNASALDDDLLFHLRKLPPIHNVLFPEVYQMFTKRKVIYVDSASRHIVPGRMIIKGDTDKEPLYFAIHDADNSCGCSKLNCPRHHYVAISNKRFFPYVEGFSNKVLKWANLPECEANQITVVQRTHFRKIINHNDLVNDLRSLGMPVEEVILENLPLLEQFRLMRRTKVFVAGHGAALTHTMFLPHESFALEILPYGYAYDRYKKLAIARNKKYLQWVNPDESKTQHLFSRDWLGGVDTSVTVIDDPSIIQKTNKTGHELHKANKLRGWFRDQNTIVDTGAIRELIRANLP